MWEEKLVNIVETLMMNAGETGANSKTIKTDLNCWQDAKDGYP